MNPARQLHIIHGTDVCTNQNKEYINHEIFMLKQAKKTKIKCLVPGTTLL